MRTPYHDLLVLTGKRTMNKEELEKQVRLLNNLLYHVEQISVWCAAHEIIDVNKGKVIQKQHLIQQITSSDSLPPFVFINNKN